MAPLSHSPFPGRHTQASGRGARQLPAFAGNDANLVTLPAWHHQPCLPPFIVRRVNDVENVAKAEVQPLAGETAVFGLVVVEEGPADKGEKSGTCD